MRGYPLFVRRGRVFRKGRREVAIPTGPGLRRDSTFLPAVSLFMPFPAASKEPAILIVGVPTPAASLSYVKIFITDPRTGWWSCSKRDWREIGRTKLEAIRKGRSPAAAPFLDPEGAKWIAKRRRWRWYRHWRYREVSEYRKSGLEAFLILWKVTCIEGRIVFAYMIVSYYLDYIVAIINTFSEIEIPISRRGRKWAKTVLLAYEIKIKN